MTEPVDLKQARTRARLQKIKLALDRGEYGGHDSQTEAVLREALQDVQACPRCMEISDEMLRHHKEDHGA